MSIGFCLVISTCFNHLQDGLVVRCPQSLRRDQGFKPRMARESRQKAMEIPVRPHTRSQRDSNRDPSPYILKAPFLEAYSTRKLVNLLVQMEPKDDVPWPSMNYVMLLMVTLL